MGWLHRLRGGNSPSPDTRERLIAAIGSWGEALEGRVRSQLDDGSSPEKLPSHDVDSIVRQVMVEFVTLVGAIVIRATEGNPHPAEYKPWAQSLVQTVFKTITEEKFTAGATSSIVDVERYRQNLASNPQIAAAAAKYGITPQAFARSLAEETAAKHTQAVRSIAPLVLRVAQETWSVAALEERLTNAVATV